MKAEVDGVIALIDRFNHRVRLARASELAISGRVLEAETLLVSKERFPNTWEELDLLARLRVREGKLAEALKLWGRAATIPTHSSCAHVYIASLQNYAAAKFK